MSATLKSKRPITATFSGRGQFAIVSDGRKSNLFQYGDLDRVESLSEHQILPWILQGEGDLQIASCETISTAPTQFIAAVQNSQALDLTLFLLDESLSDETRRFAAELLEAHLQSESKLAYLQQIFYAKPLPITLPQNVFELVPELPRVNDFLGKLISSQQYISQVRQAWIDIPLADLLVVVSKKQLSEAEVEGVCIRYGVFYEIVSALISGRNLVEVAVQVTSNKELSRDLPGVRQLMLTWIKPLNVNARPSRRDIHEISVRHAEFATDVRESEPSILKTVLAPAAQIEARDDAVAKVTEISSLVAAGNDEEARRLLDRLIASQLSSGSADHALKSLCNVATRARRVMQDDFAIDCLQRALTISSTDPVTYFQLGTQLRDCELYEEARQAYDISLSLDNSKNFYQTTLSAKAHVLTEQGRYEEAIAEYFAIPGADSVPSIRTAIADVYRKQGYLEKAMQAYVALLKEDRYFDRAWAGKAEIAKRRGDPHRALRIYNNLLDRGKFYIDDNSRRVYELAKCQLLKRVGQFEKAIELATSIHNREPYNFGALLQLSSLLTLKGDAGDGLRRILPRAGSSSIGDGHAQLLRGLTLYRLNRAAEARKHLLQTIDLTKVLLEDRPLVICAQAFAHLSEKDSSSATTILADVESVDRNVMELKKILRAHAALVADQSLQVTYAVLPRSPRSPRELRNAADSIRRGDLNAAINYELNFFIAAA